MAFALQIGKDVVGDSGLVTWDSRQPVLPVVFGKPSFSVLGNVCLPVLQVVPVHVYVRLRTLVCISYSSNGLAVGWLCDGDIG